MKIVFDHLTKRFPSLNRKEKEDVIAVNDFNFEIPDGKLISLLGPSGCGKSTCLNLISGLQEPSEGKIYFGNEDVTEIPPEKRGIGLVFQNYALYPHLTVEENIRFPLENIRPKIAKEEMKERVLKAAKLVQIDGLLERKPKEMSGGQQQRVAIARALVKNPRVLLLDEPLSNLDARLRLQTREEIKRIQKETGVTTIFVTHDQEEAMSISDFIIVMKAGVKNQMGKPQDVYDDPCNLFVAEFLGTPQINTFSGTIRNESVYVGEDEILKAPGQKDRDVWVAIRPEGFVLNPKGSFHLNLNNIEVMGRDISVVATKKEAKRDTVRIIISAENMKEISGDTVTFDIKSYKAFVFEKDSEERIVL